MQLIEYLTKKFDESKVKETYNDDSDLLYEELGKGLYRLKDSTGDAPARVLTRRVEVKKPIEVSEEALDLSMFYRDRIVSDTITVNVDYGLLQTSILSAKDIFMFKDILDSDGSIELNDEVLQSLVESVILRMTTLNNDLFDLGLTYNGFVVTAYENSEDTTSFVSSIIKTFVNDRLGKLKTLISDGKIEESAAKNFISYVKDEKQVLFDSIKTILEKSE